ncbi:MAG: HAMP domain-containing protein [Xanthomonadales bacterium]|nr:HAMP domain-containing protein [Gammaproteobacteria bacterium]NNK51032.1 HAMP domain-containing protein [Xanthomonadales bacterium]
MLSLFWKLFLTMWLSIVGFSAAIGWLNDKLAREQWAEEPANTFSRGMIRITQRAQQAIQMEGRRALREELLNIPRMTRSHIYILDEGQKEMLGRDKALEQLVDRGTSMDTVDFQDAEGNSYTIFTVNRTPPATLLAPGPQGTAMRLIAAAAISALISYFLARSLVTPLEELRRASRKIAAGDLATRVSKTMPGRQDEIGQLATDFDVMTSRLQAMQQANRRLLQDVSHELRSPLARLSVALEIARKKGAGEIESELDRIGLEGDRLESLVNDVLGMLRESSETAARQDAELDLTELLTDLVEVVNYEVPEGKPGIQWEAPASCTFHGDRELLWRALENLLRNALRYTDADRGVMLSLKTSKRKSSALITVRDYGCGVAEAELEKIFEPFYRVQESRDRSSGGHGLGLSIAANAVQRHGGSVRAENEDGGGLAVTISLPLDLQPV